MQPLLQLRAVVVSANVPTRLWALSPPVALVLAGLALIATFVVSCDSCHQLLGLGTTLVTCFLLEVLCLVASKCGRQPTMMKDLDFATLADSIREPEVGRVGSLGHGSLAGVVRW